MTEDQEFCQGRCVGLKTFEPSLKSEQFDIEKEGEEAKSSPFLPDGQLEIGFYIFICRDESPPNNHCLS
jgi:hypothetical protein